MDRKTTKELLHLRDWLDRAQENVDHGWSEAYRGTPRQLGHDAASDEWSGQVVR